MGGVASHHDHELVLDVLGLTEPAFAVNSAHQIVAWNDGAERLLGLSAEDVLGVRCYEALSTSAGALCVECRHRDYERARSANPAAPARAVGASEPPRAATGQASQASQKSHVNRTLLASAQSGQRAVMVTTLAAHTHAGQLRVVHLLREAPGAVAAPAAAPTAMALAPQPHGAAAAHDATRAAPTKLNALNPLDTLEAAGAAGDPGASSGKQRRPALLTQRELEVLRLLGAGHSTDDIAHELSITRVTARNHVNKVLDKLGVNSRLQAVVIASQLRLI